jgi:hypothetical protein
MEQLVEQRIRTLAQPLWESAARPYGMAMDFWLMAEQMVLEMVAATARLQRSVIGDVQPVEGELPSAAPVDRVRALAEAMWEMAGRQYGVAQDFWLAAERHTLTLMRAAAANAGAGQATDAWIQEMARLSPSAYLERIQVLAYNLWEAAGRNYGQALDFWLEAERQTLSALSQVSAGPQVPNEVIAAAKARIAKLEAEEAARTAAGRRAGAAAEAVPTAPPDAGPEASADIPPPQAPPPRRPGPRTRRKPPGDD